MVIPENVNLTWTDSFPEAQHRSLPGGKLGLANTVVTRTLGCPLGRAIILLAVTPQAEHFHTALTEQIPHTLSYPRNACQAHAGRSVYAPGVAICPYALMPNSWLPFLSSQNREDESIPRAAWLFRHSLGGFQGERIAMRRLQD